MMKPTRPKIHIIDVSEPLFAFSDLIVRCGIQLHNAEVKYMVSDDLADCLTLPIGTCLKCSDMEPAGEYERRYIYGLVEAQEERDANWELEVEGVA